MNCQEFKIEFDILYNNISSNQAPGLNDYDKSVYLTIAQDELVKSAYSGYNITKEAIEETEKRRKQLAQLIKTDKGVLVSTRPSAVPTNPAPAADSIKLELTNFDLDSYVYELPDDVWFILYEQVKFSSPGNCIYNGKTAWVMPISHDEITLSENNPFRQPNHRKVWRVDYSSLLDTNRKKVSEIISKSNIEYYKVRYLRKPRPIILTNLNLVESGLTIDGVYLPYSVIGTPSTVVLGTDNCCELNDVFHRDILKRACELAFRDYNDKNLETLIQTNQRGE